MALTLIQRHNESVYRTLSSSTPHSISLAEAVNRSLHGTQDPDVDAAPHCTHGDLMGPLGLFVQGLLAFIAFASLIVKRQCEPIGERRGWKIWFFDTSKQAIGAAVIHFANVFLADMFQGDPCTWYIVSFLLDSTVGLIVIWLGLKITQCIVIKKKWDHLIFGEYGSPPQCHAWLGQCGLYILVMLIEKLLMTFLVLFHFWVHVRRFIMAPIKNPHMELIIVMFIVPFVVNAFIFWVVDNFLKKKLKKSPHSSPSSNGDSSVRYLRAAGTVEYGKTNTEDCDTDSLLDCDEDEDLLSSHQSLASQGSELLRNGDIEQRSLLPNSSCIS